MNPFLVPGILLWLSVVAVATSLMLGVATSIAGWLAERKGAEQMRILEAAYPSGMMTIEEFCRITGDDPEAWKVTEAYQ